MVPRLQTSPAYPCVPLASVPVSVNCLLSHPAARPETWETSFPPPSLLHQWFPGALPQIIFAQTPFLSFGLSLVTTGSLQQRPAGPPASMLVLSPSVPHPVATVIFCKCKSDRVIPLVKPIQVFESKLLCPTWSVLSYLFKPIFTLFFFISH